MQDSPSRSNEDRYSRSPSRHGRSSRSPQNDERRSSPSNGDTTNKGDTVYVSGLSRNTTEEDLEAKFAKFGSVVSCQLIVDPRSKESRGFAFIKMATPEQANDAIYRLDRTELDGKTITVEKSRRGRQRSPTPGQYLGRQRQSQRGSYGGGGGGYGGSSYYGGGSGYGGGSRYGGGYGGPGPSGGYSGGSYGPAPNAYAMGYGGGAGPYHPYERRRSPPSYRDRDRSYYSSRDRYSGRSPPHDRSRDRGRDRDRDHDRSSGRRSRSPGY